MLKRKVGEIGWITPQLKKHFGIKQDVFIADLDWDAIIDCLKFVKVKYTELPKTFAVRRDFSLLLDSSVEFDEIVDRADWLAQQSDTKDRMIELLGPKATQKVRAEILCRVDIFFIGNRSEIFLIETTHFLQILYPNGNMFDSHVFYF